MADLFGEIKTGKRRAAVLRDLPSIPKTGWRAPTQPPDLSAAVGIGIDTETYDPELIDAGPGWARGRGHIVGVSIAAIDRQGNIGKWYFPIRHEVNPQDNLDPALVLPWVNTIVSNPHTYKAGANLLYDVGWLAWEGVNVVGPFHDVQFAESIIDNNARVSLEAISRKYLGVGKTTDLLETWCREAYKSTEKTWRKDIYRSPPSLVGPYAEDDAGHPLRILPYQWQTIDREGMWKPYDLDHRLIPLLVKMRMRGMRVDLERAALVREQLQESVEKEYDAIYRDFGFRLESTDSRQIAKLFDKVGVTYPRTAADGPSIVKPWLAALEHPLGTRLNDLRESEKLIGTFIDSAIVGKQVNGRVYPQLHPSRGDDNGTLLGRFACSQPNAQQIPSRTDNGKRVRTVFVPDEGAVLWRKFDFSQLHYRILADVAVDNGDQSAAALRQSYRDDPHMDYHMKVYREAAPLLGWNTDYTLDEKGEFNKEIKKNRRPIKNVNFGLIYGQSEKSLAFKAGFEAHAAQVFFQAYHQGAPYVRPTMQAIAFEAERNGYVTTLMGRRIRFDKWEPSGFGKEDRLPLPYEIALAKWGTNIRLAYLYRAVNYKIQGTEPEIMKAAMIACYESGVFDYTGVPHITVHDELDFSQMNHDTVTLEAFEYVRHTMENTTLLNVPLVVDSDTALSWGEC